jgi:AraC-like DNA-binding protein
MLHQEIEAPEILKDSIKCFWYNRRDFGSEQSSIEIMPDGYAEIVFHFGSSCTIFYEGALQPLPSPSMMGLLNQPVLLHTQGILEIIGVRCYPWTVFDLLGLPSARERVHIFEHRISELQSELRAHIIEGRIDDALNRVKEYFVDVRSKVAIDTMLFKAGVAMTRTHGTLPVSEVASAAHATVRTLERKFKHSSGFTVKDVSALMRFEQVRNQLWINPDSNLAGLAQEFGYSDQSHLSREFRRFSSTTPAAFARNARKNKLIVSDDFVAFVQA